MWDWNEIFSRPGYRFGTAPAAFMQTCAHYLHAGDRALVVAEGEGRNAVWMAQQGLDVTAFDISPVALDKARALAAARGVKVDFQPGDILDWDWQAARFDVVVAVMIQFVGPNARDRIFAGMKQAVHPGGLILLHGLSPAQMQYDTGGPGIAENLYAPAMLADRFSDFDILRLQAYEAHVTEGTAHDGTLAMIDLVARAPG